MKKTFSRLNRQLINVIVLLALVLGLLTFVQENKAATEYWCPLCSSDFAQHNKCDFLYWVGGNCYCCVEVSS